MHARPDDVYECRDHLVLAGIADLSMCPLLWPSFQQAQQAGFQHRKSMMTFLFCHSILKHFEGERLVLKLP